MKTEKTLEQVLTFNVVAGNYLKRNGYLDDKGYTEKLNTAVSLSVKSVLKQVGKIFEDMNETLDTMRAKKAATNDKKILLPKIDITPTNPGGNYQFETEKLIELKEEIKKYKKETKVDIHQRLNEDLSEFNEDELEAFSGFVIRDLDEEEIENILISRLAPVKKTEPAA